MIEHLNVLFAILMSTLYFAFIFCAKRTESKFFIFFLSSFINVFSYSTTLKNEFNFLSMIILSLVFIFVMALFYIHCELENNILSSDFVENSDIKNLVTIIIFLTGFISLCFIFTKLYTAKDKIQNMNLNNNVLSERNIVEKENDVKRDVQITTINNTRYITYRRNVKFLDKNRIFKNYNLLILFYILAIIVNLFINNPNNENER